MSDFKHRHAGHCETGVTAGLLTHYGLPLSEPMALGLSSALVFAYFPFIRVGGVALCAYRMPPGAVYKGICRNLGVRMTRRRFRNPRAATRALNDHLAGGRIAGVQTSVYWLPYFPPDMRFHFNAHNLIVYGRDGDDYLISDPVFEHPQRCAPSALETARFARGKFAPRGLMYYPALLPAEIDYRRAGKRALRRTCRAMLSTPLPWVGVSAIRRLAANIGGSEGKHARLAVGNVIRMQEEIGTGGGGFRFMYAAFLQEMSERLDEPALLEASRQMTEAGDRWRRFALEGAWYCRGKNNILPRDLESRLLACADGEETCFRQLLQVTRSL